MASKIVAQTNQQQNIETPKASGILQRTAVRSDLDAGVRLTDNQEVQPLSNSVFSKDLSQVPISTTQPQPIQAKLTIGAVGDKYEQEADRVAAQVVQRINAPTSVCSDNEKTVQRQDKGDKTEVKQMNSPILQRSDSDAGMPATPDLEASINQAQGGGQPLANNIRPRMEQAFGADFSDVNIHTDSQSDKLNQSIQAKAFTTGQDVFFRQGEYNPGSRGGQELIAHELTHVVQQNGGTGRVMRFPDNWRSMDVENLLPHQLEDICTTFKAAARENQLHQIVWRGHLDGIAAACKKHKYTIAIRETGGLSITRIAEGAKAKPHTILEKSIKESSLQRFYRNNNMLERLHNLDLLGFVGHWDNEFRLIGLRIDSLPNDIATLLQQKWVEDGENGNGYVMVGEGNIQYVPLNDEAQDGGPAITALKTIENWKTYLYTGDYDLHEVYKAGLGQIAEASREKVDLLNRLNNGTAVPNVSFPHVVDRAGKASLMPGEHPRVHVMGAYAMFQHGDQATYRMNQRLETEAVADPQNLGAGAQGTTQPVTDRWSRLHKGLRPDDYQKYGPAHVVPAVANESDEPLGWCTMQGEWYVTNNIWEHQVFRKFKNLVSPHTWGLNQRRRAGTAQPEQNA